MTALDRVRETWPDDVRDRVRRFQAALRSERRVLEHWHPELLAQYDTARSFDRANPQPEPEYKPSAEARMAERVRVAKVHAELPYPCRFCGEMRRFRTERGRNQHERSCMDNPDCWRYTAGIYVPILHNGRIRGYCLNTPEARESFASVAGDLGLPGSPASALRSVPDEPRVTDG